MLPFAIPVGTTLHTLLTALVPAEHAARVSPAEKVTPVVAVVTLGGDSPRSYTLTARGPKLDVREGEAPVRDTWLWVDGAIADLFVREWTETPRALVPAAPMPTDPRLLRRVQMVNGRLELALRDFAPAALNGKKVRASMTVAAGAAARRPIGSGDADCVLETDAATFDDLVTGKLGPDEALGDTRVDVRGKRLVAMQFAFAFAPFFPTKR